MMVWLSYTSGVVAIVTFPVKMVWRPVAFFINLGIVLLSPVILMASYVVGWGEAIVDFIASLQVRPLP